MKNLTTVSFWERHWDAQDRRGRFVRWLRQGERGAQGSFARLMSRKVPGVWRGRRIAELGGGASEMLADLVSAFGCRATAFDYSPKSLEISAEMYRQRGLQIELVEADIFELKEFVGEFDVVTHWGLIEHFDSPEDLLRTSWELLRPGGHLVFSMPNMTAAGAALWRYSSPNNWRAHVYHSDAALELAGKEVGLSLRNRFWYGPPLLRMAPSERRGLLPICVDLFHGAFLALGRGLPGLYNHGHPRISAHRVFHFVRDS